MKGKKREKSAKIRPKKNKSISFFCINTVNLYVADSHYGTNIIDMIPPDKIMWYDILNLNKRIF